MWIRFDLRILGLDLSSSLGLSKKKPTECEYEEYDCQSDVFRDVIRSSLHFLALGMSDSKLTLAPAYLQTWLSEIQGPKQSTNTEDKLKL